MPASRGSTQLPPMSQLLVTDRSASMPWRPAVLMMCARSFTDSGPRNAGPAGGCAWLSPRAPTSNMQMPPIPALAYSAISCSMYERSTVPVQQHVVHMRARSGRRIPEPFLKHVRLRLPGNRQRAGGESGDSRNKGNRIASGHGSTYRGQYLNARTQSKRSPTAFQSSRHMRQFSMCPRPPATPFSPSSAPANC